MKEYLEQQIQERRDLYKQSPKRMIGDYNGRQLLELIQNADDADSDIIEIDLDETNKILTISNTGNPFRKEGFQSLMLPNLSSKTKNCYIGNKGLGFRAIINWANKIVINSGDVEVEFSRDVVEREFNNLFDDDKKKQIRKDQRMSESTIPVAFLAVPIVRNVNSKGGWATSICIHYKTEFVEDIRKQIDTLENKILLFLKHINEIRCKNSDRSQSISRRIEDDVIKINDGEWHLYKLEEELPEELQNKDKNEKDYFSLKIALTHNLDRSSNKLFTFFPTKVDIDFPMVIHGTFDLDTSRNQLTKTNKNKYILKRLIDLIIKTAKELSDNEVSWKPLKLLNYENKNPILEEFGFYKSIDDAIFEQPLFPCIDDKYRTCNEVNYFPSDLTNLIVDTNNIDIFNNLVKPTNQIKNYVSKYRLSCRIDNLEDGINLLSKRLIGKDTKHRVNLIYLIATNKSELNAWCKFDLLINKDEKIIEKANDIYTPITTNSVDDFTLPDFVKIEFIHRELFDDLVKKFSIDLNEKARDIQRKLKDVTNIKSYEPSEVLKKIITTTNNKVKEVPNRATEYISEMVIALYKNYSRLPDKPTIPPDTKIQLLAKDNSINAAKDLYLSSSYLSGKITESLFGSIFEQKQFLADPQVYDESFPSKNEDEIERYFLWLGVNKHTKFCKKTKDPDYEKYVFERERKPDEHRTSELDVTAIDDESFRNIVKQLKKEELVFWIIHDKKIENHVISTQNNDVFKYDKKNEALDYFRHNIAKKPSYINYQFNKEKIFNDYLVMDDNSIDFINPFGFKYEHPLFKEHTILKQDIDRVLLNLGAKNQFEELSFDRVERIIKEMESSDKSTHTHKIYKLALEHYKKNKQKLGVDIRLFAKKGEDKGYFNNSEIYFTEDIQLPKKIAQDIALLDFPKRSGGKQAIEFFNIKNLAEIKIRVKENYKIFHDLLDEFNKLFESLKPYILAYRIEKLTKEKDKQEAVRKLNELSIELCNEIECSVDNEEFSLEVNDSVIFEKKYLIEIERNSTLSELRKNPFFCDTCSEILSLHFKIEGHQDDFRKVFREKDTEELEHVIKKSLGIGLLNESKELLGITDVFVSFWTAIYKSIKCPISLPLPLTTKNIDAIKGDLNIMDIDVSNINYGSLGESSNLITIQSIFESVEINISDFNVHTLYKLELSETHKTNLENIFNNNQIKYQSSLRNKLSDKAVMEQKKFLNYIANYEKNEKWIKDTIEPYKDQFPVDVDYDELWENFITKVHRELNFDETCKFDAYFESNKKTIWRDRVFVSFIAT